MESLLSCNSTVTNGDSLLGNGVEKGVPGEHAISRQCSQFINATIIMIYNCLEGCSLLILLRICSPWLVKSLIPWKGCFMSLFNNITPPWKRMQPLLFHGLGLHLQILKDPLDLPVNHSNLKGDGIWRWIFITRLRKKCKVLIVLFVIKLSCFQYQRIHRLINVYGVV